MSSSRCAALSVLVALVPLVLILFFVVTQGITALNWSFFTQMPRPVGEAGGGMANAIVGSLIVVGLGALFAVPIGHHQRHLCRRSMPARGWRRRSRFAADTLNGVPSIVIGVFVYGIAVLPFRQFSALAGGVALGIMMIPLIMRTTEELLLLVPGSLKEGALALGATRARAVFSVVAPGGAARHLHRHPAGPCAHRGRNGAAALHRLQQPLLQHRRRPADRNADRPGLHLRHLALPGLASPGVGRGAGPGQHRA